MNRLINMHHSLFRAERAERALSLPLGRPRMGGGRATEAKAGMTRKRLREAGEQQGREAFKLQLHRGAARAGLDSEKQGEWKTMQSCGRNTIRVYPAGWLIGPAASACVLLCIRVSPLSAAVRCTRVSAAIQNKSVISTRRWAAAARHRNPGSWG